EGNSTLKALSVSSDVTADASDQPRLKVAGARRVARLAAPAGPEARPLGVSGRGEENHLLAPRAARWAPRSAVNTRGTHGVDKSPVRAQVFRQHGAPPAVFVGLPHLAGIVVRFTAHRP